MIEQRGDASEASDVGRARPVQRLLRVRKFRFDEPYDALGRSYQVAVFARVMLALHAVGVNLSLVLPRVEAKATVIVTSMVLLLWTAVISTIMTKPSRRVPAAFVVDTLITLGVVLVTPLCTEPGAAPLTLAGYWLCGAALYAAMFRSSTAGVTSAVIASAGLFVAPSHISVERMGIAFIAILLAGCVGVLFEQFRLTVIEQERERLRTAALAERQRLSRIVHDGALQVLALVEREGPALGPTGERLARLASDSETQLRRHLQDRDVLEPDHSPVADLVSTVNGYQASRVTVSTMAGEVLAPRFVVDEVRGALQEILHNFEIHAGDDARAWVLLDQEVDDEAIIWVRDNGVGMKPEQAAEAAGRGRFGIRDSIVGRISAIGGSAILTSSPGAGTEWELRIPLDTE